VKQEGVKTKVLLAKPGADTHWRGTIVLAGGLREAGFEVIYIGNQSPESIVEAALQEDVDIIGLSTHSDSHMVLVPKMMQLMKDKDIEDIPVIIGGLVQEWNTPTLLESGVDHVFKPGATVDSVVGYVKERVAKH